MCVAGLHAAVTLQSGEEAGFIFTRDGMRHIPDGYLPLDLSQVLLSGVAILCDGMGCDGIGCDVMESDGIQ